MTLLNIMKFYEEREKWILINQREWYLINYSGILFYIKGKNYFYLNNFYRVNFTVIKVIKTKVEHYPKNVTKSLMINRQEISYTYVYTVFSFWRFKHNKVWYWYDKEVSWMKFIIKVPRIRRESILGIL